MPSDAHWLNYVSFVLYAIYGKLTEADAIMRAIGEPIRAIAAQIAEDRPIEVRPLYRGLLLDPAKPFELDPRLTFLSWSEDRGVAEWFACPRSVISEPLAAINPKLRSHLVELAAPRSQVLFHYTWADVFGKDVLARLALAHPLLGAEGHRQIAWALSTQCEVITEPVPGLDPKPITDLDAAALTALEQRLSPPWVVATEGIRT
jgi:hypothetical protein